MYISIIQEYKSTETRIVLRKVEIVTAGYYQCEVSGEAPLFQTAKSMNNLKIVGKNQQILNLKGYFNREFIKILVRPLTGFMYVDLPDDGPIISGSQPRYNTKDILAANCTSSNSVPAANLNWYINGEEATNAMLIPYQVKENRRGLYSSTLGLRFAQQTFPIILLSIDVSDQKSRINFFQRLEISR